MTYIKNIKCPRTEPGETQASTVAHVKYWLLRATLCFLILITYVKIFKRSSAMPLYFILQRRSRCFEGFVYIKKYWSYFRDIRFVIIANNSR